PLANAANANGANAVQPSTVSTVSVSSVSGGPFGLKGGKEGVPVVKTEVPVVLLPLNGFAIAATFPLLEHQQHFGGSGVAAWCPGVDTLADGNNVPDLETMIVPIHGVLVGLVQ